MSPYQHGEVYVTDDGGETDLDLGHYERFTSARMSRDNNITTGQGVRDGDREGAPGGLPRADRAGDSRTSRTRSRPRIRRVAKDVDVVIVEIGGTVGDIEGLPFLEAVRQLKKDVGKDHVIYVHLTLVPFIQAGGGAQDQGHPAFREGAARHRHPARRAPVPDGARITRSRRRSSPRSRCSATSRRRRSSPRATSTRSTRFRSPSTTRDWTRAS